MSFGSLYNYELGYKRLYSNITAGTLPVARTAKIITANGNAKISTAQSKFGGSSGLFDGTGDYLSIPDSADLRLLSGDYTMEAWIYPTSISSLRIIASKRTASNGWMFYLNAGKLVWNIIGYPTTGITTGASTLSINTWYHVAAVKSSTTYRVFVNGVVDATLTTSDAMLTTSVSTLIGRDGTNTARDWFGYIDEFRISNTARYTSNFTPSTSAFTNDSNTLLLVHADGANNSTTFTDDVS